MRSAAKAFYLLKCVLADEGKSAICKIVLKDREQLAALNPYTRHDAAHHAPLAG